MTWRVCWLVVLVCGGCDEEEPLAEEEHAEASPPSTVEPDAWTVSVATRVSRDVVRCEDVSVMTDLSALDLAALSESRRAQLRQPLDGIRQRAQEQPDDTILDSTCQQQFSQRAFATCSRSTTLHEAHDIFGTILMVGTEFVYSAELVYGSDERERVCVGEGGEWEAAPRTSPAVVEILGPVDP